MAKNYDLRYGGLGHSGSQPFNCSVLWRQGVGQPGCAHRQYDACLMSFWARLVYRLPNCPALLHYRVGTVTPVPLVNAGLTTNNGLATSSDYNRWCNRCTLADVTLESVQQLLIEGSWHFHPFVYVKKHLISSLRRDCRSYWMRVNRELRLAHDDDTISVGHIFFSSTLGKKSSDSRAAVYYDMGSLLSFILPQCHSANCKEFPRGSSPELP